jgi:hypothetical protein
MKKAIVFLLLIVSTAVFAQKDKCKPTYDPETGREYYNGTELYTELSPQNELAFDSLTNSFKITSAKYHPEQVVHFAFIIETNGGPTFYKLIEPAGDKELEKEIVHVLTRMPRFDPGKCNGKKVPTYTDVELHPFKK